MKESNELASVLRFDLLAGRGRNSRKASLYPSRAACKNDARLEQLPCLISWRLLDKVSSADIGFYPLASVA